MESRFVAVRRWALGLFLVAAAFIQVTKTVNDPDFFWHLKTGEWIWENRRLPDHDPFAYTTPDPPDAETSFGLTSYWAAQVAYHLFMRLWGVWGLVLMRAVILGLLLLAVARRRTGDPRLFLGLLVSLFLVLASYPLDRPQLLSFLFFAWVLSLLESMRSDPRPGHVVRAGAALAPLMAAWANCHRAFVLGQAVILLYLLAEGLKFALPGRWPGRRGARASFLAMSAAALLASLLNPNGWRAVRYIRLPAWLTAANAEYFSTPEAFRQGARIYVIYWAVLALTLAAVVRWRRKAGIVQIVLLAVLGYMSFRQNRYVAFFMVAAVPVAARLLSRARPAAWMGRAVLASSLVAVVFFTHRQAAGLGDFFRRTMLDPSLPFEAAEFIESRGPAGNMFNHYNYGGYLIWRLGPARKVFIDGRIFSREAYQEAWDVYMGSDRPAGGLPRWKAVLEKWGVGYVVTPFLTPAGELLPLTGRLLMDPGWVPVFLHGTQTVFVRNGPENGEIIRAEGVDPGGFAEAMLAEDERLLGPGPNLGRLLTARGDLLVFLGRAVEAEESYRGARDAGDEAAAGRIEDLARRRR